MSRRRFRRARRHGVVIASLIVLLALVLTVAACSGPSDVDENILAVGAPQPADDATGQELSLMLNWIISGNVQNVVSVDVYFGMTPDPPLVEEDYLKGFYVTGPLDVSRRYFWRIVVNDAGGDQQPGPVWDFKTRDGTWSPMLSNTSQFLSAVWASAEGEAFAVGNGGTIRRWDGTNWVGMTSSTQLNLNDVWGVTDTTGVAVLVVAVGNTGTVRHFSGGDWEYANPFTPSNLWGVWGSGEGNTILVGDAGIIRRFDGSQWSHMQSPTALTLNAVWGTSEDNIFAVGSAGTILRFDGSEWGAMQSGTSEHLTDVWCAGPNNVFAVGANGIVLNYDGFSWNVMPTHTTEHIYGVWGTSGKNVFAVGTIGMTIRYDGESWYPLESNFGGLLRGLWGVSPTDVLTSGDNGTILRYGP